MAYTNPLSPGTPASGANLPPGADGPLGWYSGIFLEMLKANQTLSETALLLSTLQETNQLLGNIALSLQEITKRK
jgi:hypothetical protein